MQAIADLAERWPRLRRLELAVSADDAPAIRLYKKSGFRINGIMLEFAFRDGRCVDSHMMARQHK